MSIQFARNQAEALVARLGPDTPPVDVKRIAEGVGLAVVTSALPDDVSGLLVTNPAGSYICVRSSDHRHRRRFTIAHEVGHYVLRHQFERGAHVHVDRGNIISQRGVRASEGVDPKEIEANQFAACLLMPARLLRQRVLDLGVAALVDYQVAQLAAEFEVSEQAMTIRLATLRLL